MPCKADPQDLITRAFESSQLPLPGRRSGKVRESYLLGDDKLLLVTTDRLSAFDRVLAKVPYKGQVLNQLSTWWFEQTAEIIPNHALSTPDPNALLARKAQPFPIEVVVRGYISGESATSLWYRYAQGERTIYGYQFPGGLRKNQILPAPVITPTTKGGPTGHDERLTCAEVTGRGLLDNATWEQVQSAALAVFQRGQVAAKRAGLSLVDTKYEFGRTPDEAVVLIDEIHTPDSSRFWKADTYQARFEAGREPENFDKELVRLAYTAKGYRGDGEPPVQPASLWLDASRRYIAIYEMLTGQPFVPGAYPVGPRLLANLQSAGIL
jgi:phosphoribosylaminoimidazole-succinocarboxamide synthase